MVLTINVLTSIVAGPVLGPISARLGKNRIVASTLFAGIIGVTWIIFFLPAEPRGMTALIIVNIIMAFFTPSSNFGFDDIREELDRRIVATATGLSNMGGFFAGMIAAQAIGIMLDYSSNGQAYTWTDFRFAWIAAIVAWAIGITGLVIFRIIVQRRRRARRLAGDGVARVVAETECE